MTERFCRGRVRRGKGEEKGVGGRHMRHSFSERVDRV